MFELLGVLGVMLGALIAIGGWVSATHPLVFLGFLVMSGSVIAAASLAFQAGQRALASTPMAFDYAVHPAAPLTAGAAPRSVTQRETAPVTKSGPSAATAGSTAPASAPTAAMRTVSASEMEDTAPAAVPSPAKPAAERGKIRRRTS